MTALDVYTYGLPVLITAGAILYVWFLGVSGDRREGRPTSLDPLLDRLNAWWPSRPPRK